ncbi:MAG TPA: hypothetical protein V6C58_26235 [Allocoleopsis sp.]
MPNTAEKLYTQIIIDLSPTERLRLATLILNDLVKQESSIIDQSDTWTEQDQEDILNFSLQ